MADIRYEAGKPAYFNPTASLGNGPLSKEEISAQAAGDLGYLALLFKKATSGGSPPAGVQAEIERILSFLRQNQNNYDEAIGNIVNSYLADFSNPPTVKEMEAFFVSWERDGQYSTIVHIADWFAGKFPGSSPYQFNTSTSPDTVFAFLMFLNSIQGSSLGSLLSDDVNKFYSQGNAGAEFPAHEYAAGFIAAYLKERGLPGVDFLLQILPPSTAPADDPDGYADFLNDLERGVEFEPDFKGLLVYLSYFLNGQ